jgi:hypothetical protein
VSVKATALPPVYAEGQQIYDLSVDLAGGLRMTGGGGGTTNQGSPASLANAWPVKLTDGTNVLTVNADGSVKVDVLDREPRILGRVKLHDSTGAVIDPAIKGQLPASLGQKVMASSLAVVMASDQTAIPVSALVGAPAFVRVSDGAAALIGQKTSALSLPVVLPSDQGAVASPIFLRLSDGAAALIGQKVMASSLPVALASDQSAIPEFPSPLCVVIAPAANTAGTITLPAVAGQFHYITAIEVTRNATAALAGTATLAITTTNLPGGGTWFRVGNAMVAGGTQKDVAKEFRSPIKSSVVNTASTIVFPAPGAAVLWTATVWYYTAA